ncbi:MAG: ACT domain-containing protein [Spirochaetaceae bacterium]|jgi:hypothetical protein|nr:ACT domain-containing protein [Spirochaetaceae bacterium]
MAIKQISVFLENSSGRLAEVTGVLSKAGINLRAISIADTADFGILRLIVDKEEAAQTVLTQAGFTTRTSSVVAVEIEDRPGSLATVMELFRASKVNIEYLYASLQAKADKAVVIFKLKDLDQGLRIIRANGLPVVESF